MAKRRARGEGSIRKRSDGRWEGRYTVGRNEETGKLIYKNVLAKTQAECKNKLREAIGDHEKRASVKAASLPDPPSAKGIPLKNGSDSGTNSIQGPIFGRPHGNTTATLLKTI